MDGNQNPISYDVDSWGRITGIGFADGVKEGYEYTPAGQVSRTIDGNGNAVQYRYNSLGKISERIDQLGFTETFRYDEEGNLSLHIDRDGRQLQRACNVFGQPVYEKASDAEGKHTNISTWHYDSLGRVTRAVCDGKSYEYIYDAYGNLKEKRSNGKRLVSYTHDRAGQITEIRDPEGVCTRYEYDILGRRSRIYNNDGLEVRYGYDALNRIRHIRYGNGVETAYTYDGDGNIRTLETKAGENVLLSFAYQYDGNGNRTAKTGTQAALGGITTGNNALDLSYAYDVRGQLLEERRNGASVCYAYDKAGNRIRKTDVQGEIRYLYNEKNQLVEEESPADRKQFSYDRQGGIIEEKNLAGIRRFSYNSRHQQTRVETETGNVQENRYDAEDLRFELLENGRRTSFVYHDGELLEEGREEQKTSYHLGAGMEAFRRGQELSYYHRDEQLSTVFVTDGQGEIRNSYQYDAFGIPLETTEQLNNRIRYTGQQYDELTEQYYLRARYYNPVAGRFMQEDVYQGDGLNLYAYCGNNPVVYDDPSGYASTSTGKACPPQGKISESVDETSYGKSSSNCTELVPYYPANNGAESGSSSLQDIANKAAQEYNAKYNPYERAISKGYTDVKKTANGGVSFQGSEYMYYHNGQEARKVIQATGNRNNDFKMANQAMRLLETPDGYVWHHLDDYNVEKNTITMELVMDEAHNASKPHSGGCAQYDSVNGPTYNKKRR